jgi:hypothetical protein
MLAKRVIEHLELSGSEIYEGAALLDVAESRQLGAGPARGIRGDRRQGDPHHRPGGGETRIAGSGRGDLTAGVRST